MSSDLPSVFGSATREPGRSSAQRGLSGPELIPADPRGAAEVEQWISLVNTTIDPCLIRAYFLGNLIPNGADGKPDRAVVDGALPMMQKQIGALDQTVARSGYLAAKRFTLADINLLPILYYVQRFPEGAQLVQSAKYLFRVLCATFAAGELQCLLPAAAAGRL